MNIVVADDEPMILEDMVEMVQEAVPDAQVQGFANPLELIKYAKEHTCDIAFLDIEMGVISGIEVAKKLKISNPQINLIFATGYEDYMKMAFKLHASGYIMKPAKVEDIRTELENLRHPVTKHHDDLLEVRCFGTFDVFYKGESLSFSRSKTRELLAYLIDRRGSSVTSGELCAILWEDAQTDKKTGHYLQVIKKDLITTLEKIHMEKAFLYAWNKYRIDPEMFSCDYYDYLANKQEGVRAYNGEYMAQYSWGEVNRVLQHDGRTG